MEARVVTVGGNNVTVVVTKEEALEHDKVLVIDEDTFGKVVIHCYSRPEEPRHKHEWKVRIGEAEYDIEIGRTQAFGDPDPVFLVVQKGGTTSTIRAARKKKSPPASDNSQKRWWEFWK